MKLNLKTMLFTLALLLLGSSSALAAKTFVVLPFTVNGPAGYKYLEQSIPSMIVSRLHWDGHYQAIGQENPAARKPAATDTEAEKARAAMNADYVVWGTVNIIGEDANLEVQVRDRNGKTWPKSRDARVSQLIPSLKSICDNINKEVFGRSAQTTVQTKAPATVNQMNPELIHNQDSNKETYLNPNFRYSGGREGDETVIRTQQLPYKSVGMEICDADNNGTSEIFILNDTDLVVYNMVKGGLKELDKFSLGTVDKPLAIRSIKLDRSGFTKIIVDTLNNSQTAVAYIFTFDGKKLNRESRHYGFYLNVVNWGAQNTPTLVGQASDESRVFIPGVYEMIKNGDNFVQGGRISLPDGGNVFNFAQLPGGSGRDSSDKLLMYSSMERLRVYSSKNSRLSESDEKYSGSSLGIETTSTMPGMNKGEPGMEDYYYVPLRMIPCDLDGDGNYEVILNHPISTASELFTRYRSFPQSEIHALYWDGSGMNLQWKTKRIKGTIVDYTIADVDGNGILDLAVCINTHPGALGLKSIKTMLFIYPLDQSRVDGTIEKE